jgi:hypothetical protein
MTGDITLHLPHHLAFVAGLAAALASNGTVAEGGSTGSVIQYPDKAWPHGDPMDLGWSTQKLSEINQYLQTVPPSTAP